MKTVEQEWLDFRIKAIPPTAGEMQAHDMRVAFYAGVLSFFSIMSTEAEDMPDGGDVSQQLSAIRTEVETFFEEAIIEMAARQTNEQ